MRFTLKKFLLVFVWMALVLVCFKIAGPLHAAVLGTLTAMVLYLTDRLLGRWRELSRTETTLLVIALAASVGGTGFAVTQMVDDYRTFSSASNELRRELHQDPRFRRVFPYYSGSTANRVLTLRGSVGSAQDEEMLRQKADKQFWHFKTEVRWRITIDTSLAGQ